MNHPIGEWAECPFYQHLSRPFHRFTIRSVFPRVEIRQENVISIRLCNSFVVSTLFLEEEIGKKKSELECQRLPYFIRCINLNWLVVLNKAEYTANQLSQLGGQGQNCEWAGAVCGWAGAVMIRNPYFSRFRIIQNFALQTYRHTYRRRDTASYRVA